MTVWAFNRATDDDARQSLYQSIRMGKSRFGWSSLDEHNLRLKDNWSDNHSRNLFLLQISKGDWIVHVNTPSWGRCIAVRVVSEYGFDEGLDVPWGKDFRHCFEIDVESIIEFNRRDPNVLPSVNLNPRYRYQRVYAAEDFLKSIENLKHNVINLNSGESKEEFHLKDGTNRYLSEIAKLIHETHKSKRLEPFLAKVFRKIRGVVDVDENGSGWRSDYGADLIVTMRSPLGHLEIENKIIVQIKSFSGSHYEVGAVDQVQAGIEKFNGTAGMIITTAGKTEKLENKIRETSEAIDRPIDLLAADDVAKFVLKIAPELLFRLDGIS